MESTDPRGTFRLTVGGQDYRLHVGMSVLADLQAQFGQDVLGRLDPPTDAPPHWVPDLGIIVALVRLSLGRYHPEAIAADPYLVDDILSDQSVFEKLMAAAFPDQGQASGNGKRPKRAA